MVLCGESGLERVALSQRGCLPGADVGVVNVESSPVADSDIPTANPDSSNEDSDSEPEDLESTEVFDSDNPPLYDMDSILSGLGPEVQFVPTDELNPYGVWEITESLLAYENYAPEAEPWPDGPLENGKRLVITEDTFTVDAYPGEETYVYLFRSVDYVSADNNYIAKFRMLREAQHYFVARASNPAIWAEFCEAESGAELRYANRQICFVGYDTIMYTDGMYWYTLQRVQTEDASGVGK